MTRKVCVALILIALFIPLAKKITGFPVDHFKLNGAVVAAETPKFTWHSFFEGEFQDKTTAWLQDTMGFKAPLIGLKNQIDYSIFGTLHYGVELGRNGQLFSADHIENHFAGLTISDDSLRQKVRECMELKAALDSRQIATLFLFAPAKPNIYEHELPAKYKGKNSGANDYHRILQALNEKNLPCIDFNVWFSTMCKSSPYPLFSKLGTHWNYYGACLAMDSLAKYIEKDLNIKLPAYSMDSILVTNNTPYESDKDLGRLLNLLIPITPDTLAYPNIHVTFNPEIQTKPKILFIGDSFVWPMISTKMPANLFSADSHYWFYRHSFYLLEPKWLGENPDEIDLDELLHGTAMVIFVSTEAQNHRFDFGLFNAMGKRHILKNSEKK